MNKRLMKVAGALIVVVILGTMLAACGKAVGKDTATADDIYYDESYGNYAITVKLIIGNPDPEGEPLFSGTVTLKTIKHMAYEALEAACASKSIAVEGINGYSSFITSLAGVGYIDNGNGTYSSWSININGGYSPGLGAQQLRDGDLLEVRYITQDINW